MRHRFLQRGFSLIEAVIVISLAAAALTVAMIYISSLAHTQQREQLIEKMATEMAQIERAMNEHMTGTVLTAVVTRTRTEVTIPQLITANRLPADFANRDGAVGTSPFGQPYKIYVFRITGTLATGENALTWVITESGGALASRLARIGAEDTDDGVLGIKQSVSGALAKTHRLIAGIIRPTTTIVSGDFNGFTKNIAYLLPAAPTAANRSWVAVLHGFADLQTDPTGVTGPTAGFVGDCRILTADQGCIDTGYGYGGCKSETATWVKPACSSIGAGWIEIDQIPVCEAAGTLGFRSTPVGPLSYSTQSDNDGRLFPVSSTVLVPTCTSACAETYPCTRFHAYNAGYAWDNFRHYQDIRLNDTSLATPLCKTDTVYNGARNEYGSLVCGYGRTDVRWASQGVLNGNPKHLLCCRPE